MSMKLIILGLLMEKERHPYEIRQTIKGRNWNHSFKLRDGSLYYAVDQLREEGSIEAAEVISVPGANRPDKTIYRITEKGKSELLDLLYNQMQTEFFPRHPMFMALPFAMHAETARIEEIIGKQLHDCQCRIEHLQGVLKIKNDRLPGGSIRMIEGIIQFSMTEKAWLEEVLESNRNGELLKGKPPNNME
jgi:DNA-binding PadR family transcriptional regulator